MGRQLGNDNLEGVVSITCGRGTPYFMMHWRSKRLCLTSVSMDKFKGALCTLLGFCDVLKKIMGVNWKMFSS